MESTHKTSPFLIASLIGVTATLIGFGGYVYYTKHSGTTVSEDAPNTAATVEGFEVAASKAKSSYNWVTKEQGPYKDSIGYATSTDLMKCFA
jgi:hypothetical protein